MAIFGTKSKSNKKGKTEKTSSVSLDAKKAPTDTPLAVSTGTSSVLLRPRVTEKSSMLSEKGSYVFEVNDRANKHEIFEAIKTVYGVTPIRVNIVNLPAKRVFSRGKAGMKSGVKKAIVYLKSGDKIEIV